MEYSIKNLGIFIHKKAETVTIFSLTCGLFCDRVVTNRQIFSIPHKEGRELVNLPVKLLPKLSSIPFDKRWVKRYAFIMSHRGPARHFGQAGSGRRI